MSESYLSAPADHVQPLRDLVNTIPEIAEHIDTLVDEGSRLVADYGVQQAFFDEPSNVVLFAGLAKRRSAAQTENGGTKDERNFVDAASKMLFVTYSSVKSTFAGELGADETLSDEAEAEVLEQFTNPEVTAELRAAFDSDMLTEVRQRLGVDAHNETPFTLCVLNIAHLSQLRGLTETDIVDPATLDPAQQRLVSNFDEYSRKTFFLGSAFSAQVLHNDDNSKVMIIPLPIAQKILHPETTNSEVYTEVMRQNDLSQVRHEYVHTQGCTLHGFMGMALEERRADYLSGAIGYPDLMWLANDLKVVSGCSVNALLDEQQHGARDSELYTALANELGLDMTLELAAVLPRAYAAPERKAQGEVSSYLGGYDGVLQRLYQRALVQPDTAQAMNERLDGYVDRFLEVYGTGDRLDNVLGVRSWYGMNFVTRLITERINDRADTEEVASSHE